MAVIDNPNMADSFTVSWSAVPTATGYILEESRSIIVLVNKWDLIEKDTYTMDAYTKQVRAELKFLDYVPVLYVSALTGQRVHKVLPLAFQVVQVDRIICAE